MQLDVREIFVTKGAANRGEVDAFVEGCLNSLHALGLPPLEEVLVPEREGTNGLYVPQWTYDLARMRVALTVHSARDRRVYSIRLTLLVPAAADAPEFCALVKALSTHTLGAGYLLLGTRQQTRGGSYWWGVPDDELLLHDDGCSLSLRDARREAFLFYGR